MAERVELRLKKGLKPPKPVVENSQIVQMSKKEEADYLDQSNLANQQRKNELAVQWLTNLKTHTEVLKGCGSAITKIIASEEFKKTLDENTTLTDHLIDLMMSPILARGLASDAMKMLEQYMWAYCVANKGFAYVFCEELAISAGKKKDKADIAYIVTVGSFIVLPLAGPSIAVATAAASAVNSMVGTTTEYAIKAGTKVAQAAITAAVATNAPAHTTLPAAKPMKTGPIRKIADLLSGLTKNPFVLGKSLAIHLKKGGKSPSENEIRTEFAATNLMSWLMQVDV